MRNTVIVLSKICVTYGLVINFTKEKSRDWVAEWVQILQKWLWNHSNHHNTSTRPD